MIYSILAETELEYLGLGNLSSVSWGTMLFFAQKGDALLLGAGLALLSFGIDEVANPRLRKESTPKVKLRKVMLKLRRRSAFKEVA